MPRFSYVVGLYCIESIFTSKPIACAVNAQAGHELELREFADDGEGRTVAVVGGGPAGVEAARVLALRGFRPIVYEARTELGRQLVPGRKPPGKDEIAWYRDYLARQLEELDIDVRLGTEATPAIVAEEDPYAVVEMLEEIAPEAHPINRIALQGRLADANVQVMTERELTRVHNGGVEMRNAGNGETQEVPADWVVLALGLEKASEESIQPWREAFDRVCVVGDANEPRRVAEAVREGFDAAYVLP